MSKMWLEILLTRYRNTKDINIVLEIEDMIITYIENLEYCLELKR